MTQLERIEQARRGIEQSAAYKRPWPEPASAYELAKAAVLALDAASKPEPPDSEGEVSPEAEEIQKAVEEGRRLDEEGKLGPGVKLEAPPEDWLRVVWREPDGQRRRCSKFVSVAGPENAELRRALTAGSPRLTVYSYDEAQRMFKERLTRAGGLGVTRTAASDLPEIASEPTESGSLQPLDEEHPETSPEPTTKKFYCGGEMCGLPACPGHERPICEVIETYSREEIERRLLSDEACSAVRADRDQRESPDDDRDRGAATGHRRGRNIGADLRAAFAAAFPEPRQHLDEVEDGGKQ